MDNNSPKAPTETVDATAASTVLSPLSSSSSSSSTSLPSYTARVSRTCVYPPTIIHIRDPDSPNPASASPLQFSLHTAPLTLQRELQSILPALTTLHTTPSTQAAPLLILPTFQPSTTPLTTFTVDTEREKNRLLETFSGFARALCQHLTGRGYFADYIDPCTGHPALSRSGGAVYSEVDGASALLRYRLEQAGCCSVVLHPVWGSACYPASCVTNARVEAVLEGLERVRRRWEVRDEQQQSGEEMIQDPQQQTDTGGNKANDSDDGSGEERRVELVHSQGRQTHTQGGKLEEEKVMSENVGETQRIIPVSSQAFGTSR